ncbi:MAG: DnaD domain protein [Bacillota bacterium]|nr:DnaD domain protein [Bacillota bacterium]
MEVAIVNDVKKLRYIEATLYNWKDQKITTAEAAVKQLKELLAKGGKGNYGGKKINNYKSYSGIHREDESKKQSKYAGYKPNDPDVPSEPIFCEGLI